MFIRTRRQVLIVVHFDKRRLWITSEEPGSLQSTIQTVVWRLCCATMHATYRVVRRTGAVRKAMTLPPNLTGLPSNDASEGGRGDTADPAGEASEVEKRWARGQSLALSKRGAYDFSNVDTQLDNDSLHSSYGDENNDDDDYDDDDSDFTDEDDDDDEIIYENPEPLVAEVQSLEKKRLDVAKELLHTEQTYLEKLTFLRMIKRQLDSMNSAKHIFPPEEPDRMFPCIEELFQFHSSIRASLERTIRKWTEGSSSIAIVFLPKLTEFRVYTEFIKSFPLSIKTLELWREKEERFSKLLTIFQQHSACCVISLQDVMHEPYIRLQRLKLMFQRYKKCLPSEEQEYFDIERVVITIDTILHDCEGEIQIADNLETLLKLSERIEGVLSHFGKDTRLLKEGLVLEIDPRGRHVGKKVFNKLEKQLHLLLFDSFILICSPIEPNKKQTIESKVKVSAVKLLACDFFASMGYDSDSGFILQTPAKARLIVCPSAKDTLEWKKLIEEAKITTAARPSFKREGSLSTMDFSCAPVWIPDDYVSDCMLCLERFNLIRRRHHCRGCGIIVCSDCSPGKIRLPYDNLSLGRVCRKCFRRAKKYKQEIVSTSARSSAENNRSCDDGAKEKDDETLVTFWNSGESREEEI